MGEAPRLPRPSKIVCLARNYEQHAREMGDAGLGPEPALAFFLKPPSALIGSGEPILLPREVGRVDHEVELAVVIGARCDAIAPEAAMRAVAGYAVFLDITARDLQQRAKAAGAPWTAAKGFDTFAPMGEAAPADSVPDPHDLAIELRVNGQLRQQGRTSEMRIRIPEIVARLSAVMTLEPGDVVATGTPAGVGPLHPGDLVAATIDRLPPLQCPVRWREERAAQPKGT